VHRGALDAPIGEKTDFFSFIKNIEMKRNSIKAEKVLASRLKTFTEKQRPGLICIQLMLIFPEI